MRWLLLGSLEKVGRCQVILSGKMDSPSCIIFKEQKCSNGKISLMNNLLLIPLDPESKSGMQYISNVVFPVRLWYIITVTLFQNLVFFNNPPSVTLGQLLEVMSWQFSSYVGRGLNSEQLNMLAEKLTGESWETGLPLVRALESFKAVMLLLLIIMMLSHFMEWLCCIARHRAKCCLIFISYNVPGSNSILLIWGQQRSIAPLHS